MKKLLVALCCFVFIFSFTGCAKRKNIKDISANLTNYNIDLELDEQNKSVKATTLVEYVNNSSAILRIVKFHLYPQFFTEQGANKVVANTKLNEAYPNGLSYASFAINRVLIDTQDVPIEYAGDCNGILNVRLPFSLVPKDRVGILIEYEFTLPNCAHRFGYCEDTINLANFYPIACVYEEDDFDISGYHPNGDPFFSDVANYSVNVCADAKYIVAGTGERVDEKVKDNKKTTTFFAQAVRDFACVLSDHFNVATKQSDNVKYEYYYYNDQDADKSIKAGMDAINVFGNKFGKYPYKVFSIVQCDFIYGGMEYPTLVMISDNIDNQDDYLNVIVHETAHQWWYAVVGNDEYTYPWLDEALTEFSTILFYDYAKGYNLNHKDMVKVDKDNYSLFITVYQDVLGDIDTSMRAIDQYKTEPEYTYCTYVKGVLMFESLYQLIGKSAFLDALSFYYNQNQFGITTPDNLISAFEKSAKCDLKNFFSSWVDGKVVIR